MIKTFLVIFAIVFLNACEGDHENLTYLEKGIVRSVQCYDNFLDGHGCQSAIKIVSGKFSGITCHTDGSNPGQIGDTIFVEIVDWNGSSQTCRLK